MYRKLITAGAKQCRFRLARRLLRLFAAEYGAFLCVFGGGEGRWRGAFQDSLTRGSDSLVSRAATMSLINPKPLPAKETFSLYLAIMDHFAQQRPEKTHLRKRNNTVKSKNMLYSPVKAHQAGQLILISRAVCTNRLQI